MPFDDDIDLGTELKNKEYLFSSDFMNDCKGHGIRPVYLFSNGCKTADRHGSAVRLQLLDNKGTHATIDVFFYSSEYGSPTKLTKIDGWSNKRIYYNDRETFEIEDILPLQKRQVIDMIPIQLPAKPRKLLLQQYGDTVFTTAKTRPILFSHAFPFIFLKALWLNRPSN